MHGGGSCASVLLPLSYNNVGVVRLWCLASASAFRSASPMFLCLLARAPECMLSVYALLQQGRKTSASFVGIHVVTMYLLSGSLMCFPSGGFVAGLLASGLFLMCL